MPRDLARQAVAQYGVGRGRLFYVPSISLFYSLLNLRSPLFRDNLPLRKAIGYAIDRPELFRPYPFGAHRSAQLIPPGIAGFSPAANVFPITGADVRTARRLARGHLRGRHAVLYSLPSPDNLRQSEIIKYNLGQIGLDVEIRPFSFSALFTKLADPAERWDLTGGISWFADYPDPSDFMTPLFTTLPGGYWNLSGLNDPGLNRRVLAANRLLGPRRIRAFARIAHDLLRETSYRSCRSEPARACGSCPRASAACTSRPVSGSTCLPSVCSVKPAPRRPRCRGCLRPVRWASRRRESS